MKFNIKKITVCRNNSIHFVTFLFFLVQYTLYSKEISSIFKRGERFFNDSLFNLAFEQYQKYLSLKSNHYHYNDPEAYFKSAICQYKMNNYKEAADSFEEYIQLFQNESNIINALYEAGTIRKKLGEYDKASDWFFTIWNRFAGSSHSRRALFEAAFCAEKVNNYKRATKLYQLYCYRFPQAENAKQAVFSLVNLYINQQNYLKTEEILNDLEKRWKYNKKSLVRIFYYKAILAIKRQRIGSAEKYFQSMAEIDTYKFPEKVQAYKKYIEVLTILKKYKAANRQFKNLYDILSLQSSEDLFRFYKSWAENSQRAGSYKEAILLNRKILDLYPEKINVYQIRNNIAECYIGINDFRNAIAVYRRYLQLPEQKNKDIFIYKIGKIYQEKFNSYYSALREYETLVTLYPESSYYNRAVFSIARCQEKVKEFKNAVRTYDYLSKSGKETELIAKANKRASYIRNFHLRNTEAAIVELTELIREQLSSVSLYTRLAKTALVHVKYMKNFKKGLKIYQDIEKLPNLPDSLCIETQFNIADIYYKLFEKATFENDSNMALHSKRLAISYYNKLINTKGKSLYNEKATYKILMLTSPDISEFELFVKKYPLSRYLVDVLLKIGHYYEKTSDTVNKEFNQKAISAYQQILKVDPTHSSSPTALVGLARNYLKLDKFDSTEIIISKYSRRYPQSYVDDEIYYIQGILYVKMKKNQKAIDVFNEFLYIYPLSLYAEKVRFELASVQHNMERFYEALNNYRKYIQDFPNGSYKVRVNYGIAKCFVKLEKNNEAVKIFNKILDSIRINDNDDNLVGDIHFELANIAKKGNNVHEALDHYKTTLSSKSFFKKDEVLILIGDIYFGDKLYTEAHRYYLQALSKMETEIDSVRILTKLISSLIMSGKTKKAQKRVFAFKEKYGERYRDNFAEIIYYEGTYLLIKKKYDKAINRYKYILNKYADSDRSDDAEYQIALILYYQNKMEDALTLFQEFQNKYPDSEFVPLTYFKIAMIFHGQHDFVRSVEYFTKVISAGNIDSKTRFRAANNAAVALQKISSWSEAAEIYKTILSEFSNQIHLSSYHLKAGFCLLQASNVGEALKQFKKAVVNPKKEDEPEILYWIASCYSKLGEYSKAISEYLKVPFFYSGFGKWGITAEFEAARLYEKKREYNKAATLYRKVVRSDGEHGIFGKKALAMIQRLDDLAGDEK